MADIKSEYGTHTNLTVTGLASMATSSGFTSGWESAVVDNTTDKFLDYLITGKITTGTTPTTATQIRVYVFALIDASTYPDTMDGTEGTDSWTDSEELAAGAKLAAVMEVDTTTNAVLPIPAFSVAQCFGGICPPKFGIYIAHNTGVNLNSSGHQVTIQGFYLTST